MPTRCRFYEVLSGVLLDATDYGTPDDGGPGLFGLTQLDLPEAECAVEFFAEVDGGTKTADEEDVLGSKVRKSNSHGTQEYY